MASLCSADVDVVVNLVGADAVDRAPVEAVSNFVDLSSMDNSDLFVAMCLPGTFSSDNEGVCHDCQQCLANQYETQACIPTRDRTCANCTVCGSNDIELCQCAVKTSQCVTGDRVCLKVPPTVVTLVVDFSSNGVLTAKQQTFVRSGLAVGYTDWLASEFDVDPDTVELTDFVRTGTLTYKAYFRFNEVYGQAKISSIQSQPQEFFQGGIVYTFGGGGRRRRLLQAGANLVSVNGVSSGCDVNKTCSEPFTEFKYNNGTNCSGSCYPILCPPGLTGSAKNCFPCGPGTYKNETGYQDCRECPAGYTSPTAANSSEACTPLPPNSTTTSAAATTTTAGQSTPSPALPSSSRSATSPPPSSSPSAQTSSSLAGLQPSSSSSPATSTLSTAQPTASQAGSSQSSAPSAGSSSTSQAPPQTTPSGGTGPTTGISSGTGTGSPSSVVVSNVNNNNNNVNINLPPAPAPVYVNVPTAPPVQQSIYITIAPQQAPPAPVIRPVFNNYFSQQPQPQAKQQAPMHETHTHHYYDDWDLSSLFLLMVFFVLVISFTLCIIYAVDDPVYHQYQPVPQRRVRFRILRDPDTVSV